MLALLTGGTGGAKLVQGFSLEVDPSTLAVICNTGDDCILHGLYISPDVDTTLYTLAGLVDSARGWGIQNDTFVVLDWLGKLGRETWFRLGDRDLAVHITRSRLLQEGVRLSEITHRIRRDLGVSATILPMSDDRVETRVLSGQGEISFQDFFVKERWQVQVHGVSFQGAEGSQPAPGVVESIHKAVAVILCPSNPVTSIGPILAVPGIRAALKETPAPVLAVSPIIEGAPLSGPAGKLMSAVGMEVSALGVARAYRDFLDVILVAPEDLALRKEIEEAGVQVVSAPIRMDSTTDKRNLASRLLALL